MQRNYTKRFSCAVCGLPIAKRGATHWRCRSGSKRQDLDLNIRLSKLLHSTQQVLAERPIKAWTRADGPERLRELFPDMEDRL